MVFQGEYEHTIDPKGRMFLPAKYRDALGHTVVLVKWTDPLCLYVMTEEEFAHLSERLRGLPMTDKSAQDLKRMIFTKSTTVEMDAQKRILIPQSYRIYAGLEKDVMVAGVDDHLEIWDMRSYLAASDQGKDMNTVTSDLRSRGYSV